MNERREQRTNKQATLHQCLTKLHPLRRLTVIAHTLSLTVWLCDFQDGQALICSRTLTCIQAPKSITRTTNAAVDIMIPCSAVVIRGM